MRKKILQLYFPALIPKHHRAQKWHCLRGYNAAPVVSEQREIKTLHFRFKARNSSAAGKRILFFSDLHCTFRDFALTETLCSIVRSAAPDLLLCGGDLCSDAVSISLLPELLGKLSAAAPCCAAIPGNWERGKCWLPAEFWKKLFRESGWHYLCNESLEAGDWGWIYGCDDLSKGYPAILTPPPVSRENILLVHRPDTVIAVDKGSVLEKFSLALCGHTHGGQIRLPLVGAVTVPSFYGRRLSCGLYGKENSEVRMIISTGVSHASFPWRINCRREVLLIEFE